MASVPLWLHKNGTQNTRKQDGQNWTNPYDFWDETCDFF